MIGTGYCHNTHIFSLKWTTLLTTGHGHSRDQIGGCQLLVFSRSLKGEKRRKRVDRGAVGVEGGMVWGKSVASTPGRVRNLRKYLEMTCSEALVFLKFSCLPLHETGRKTHFYRATRMHSADYAVARCLSVRPSVCLSRPSVCLSVRPSHVGIVCKWLHISSIFFHHRVAPTF